MSLSLLSSANPARWASLAAARPMDRLGLLTMLSSIYFFIMWGFALRGDVHWPPGDAPKIALAVMSCLGILMPRLWPVLVINAAVFGLQYLAKMPVASNNQTTAAFVCVVILAGAAHAALRRPDDLPWREAVFEAISGPGRWLLAGLYFWGIYHKINTGFLDPAVSCAVELYVPLAAPFGLADWPLGHYGAIYSTFVIEGAAMVLLFSERWKRLGMFVGIPFHIIIGWTGYAFYKDFSTIVLVLYAMFLPRVAVEAAVADAARWAGSPERAARLGRLALMGMLLVMLASVGAWRGFAEAAPTHANFVWFFTLYALTFYAFAVVYTPFRPGARPAWSFGVGPWWLAVVPVLFFLNGASPYLGLKTESSIAMFSNLHTEGGQTNHLIHGVLPFGAGYQDEVVRIIGSNDPEWDARHAGTDLHLVRYQFDRLISGRPDLVVEIERNGARETVGPGWTNTYLEASPLMQRYLVFKPVDFARPKVCTH